MVKVELKPRFLMFLGEIVGDIIYIRYFFMDGVLSMNSSEFLRLSFHRLLNCFSVSYYSDEWILESVSQMEMSDQ